MINKKTKNKYIIPSTNTWYITYGGYTKKDSHSYDVYGQRWAYDFDKNIDGKYFHDDGNINETYPAQINVLGFRTIMEKSEVPTVVVYANWSPN